MADIRNQAHEQIAEKSSTAYYLPKFGFNDTGGPFRAIGSYQAIEWCEGRSEAVCHKNLQTVLPIQLSKGRSSSHCGCQSMRIRRMIDTILHSLYELVQPRNEGFRLRIPVYEHFWMPIIDNLPDRMEWVRDPVRAVPITSLALLQLEELHPEADFRITGPAFSACDSQLQV